MNYVIPISLIAAFLLGSAGAWAMARYAYRWGLIDLPGDRSSHKMPTPRGGGIGILAAFTLVALVSGLPETLLIPAVLLSVVSFLDDRLDLSPRARLVFQFGAALMVVLGAWPDWTWWLWPWACLCWCVFLVGTANFYNFMDGINGIAGITGAVAFGLISLFSYGQGESAVAMTALGVSGACLGFLPFNLPRARVFMGDVGSVLLGFLFGAMVFRLSRNLADFLCVAAFIFPFYADTLSTLYIRWRAGEKLSQAHRRHLYQVLVNHVHHPHWKISVAYGGLQLLLGILMLFARESTIWLQILVLVFFSVLFLALGVHVRTVKETPGRRRDDEDMATEQIKA